MSFDPREYERTGGMYSPEPEDAEFHKSGVLLWGKELDPTSPFARDLGRFVAVAAELEVAETEQLATEVPDEYVHRTNLSFDILNWSYIGDRVTQGLGYKALLVGEEGDKDGKIVLPGEQLALYMHPLEASPNFSIIGERPVIAERELVSDCTGDSTPRSTLIGHRSFFKIYHEAIMSLDGEDKLLERAFMFRTLRCAARALRENDEASAFLQKRSALEGQKSIEMYEAFVAEGLAPLGVEEVYGLMGTAIRKYIERHPEEAPLEQRGE